MKNNTIHEKSIFPAIKVKTIETYPHLLFWHSYAIKPMLIAIRIKPNTFILVMISYTYLIFKYLFLINKVMSILNDGHSINLSEDY